MENQEDQDHGDLPETSDHRERPDHRDNPEEQEQVRLGPRGPLDSLDQWETKENQVQSPKIHLQKENQENEEQPAPWELKDLKERQGFTVWLGLKEDQENQENEDRAESQAPEALKVFLVPVRVVHRLRVVVLEILDLRASMVPEEFLDQPDSEEREDQWASEEVQD